MEQKLNDKRKKLIILVSVLVVFIGITFAYIVAQISGSAIGNANITADTTDNLDFSIDKDINLNPNQFNVVEGGGGLSDTATGTASLLANSTNSSATFDYYVYFLINTNEYIYTTEDNKPEIVLTITDPTGQPVTSVDGLTYVTAQNADGTTVSGFDITTASGLINIASNYEITSSSSTQATEQDWIFAVTFINLTTNQSENGGSTLDAEIILSKDVTNYHEICEPGTMACDIARLYNEENPESNGLYYHDGTYTNEYCMFEGNEVLSFPDGTPSTNAEDCQNVYYDMGMYIDASVITGGLAEGMVEEVTWDGATCKTTTSGATVYTDMDNNTPVSQESCSGYAAMMSDTESVIMISVGSGTMETTILDAEDYSYRYAGANPNNYVCFGSIEYTCPNDNLYRIIGVFNGQVKLIKADYTTSAMLGTDGRDYYGTYDLDDASNYKGSMDASTIARYRWNNDTSVSTYGSNNWTTSEFNTINLNTNYWNYLGATWQNLIVETTWHLGGITSSGTAKAFYDGERNNAGYGSNSTTYRDEIGLMYPSDYGYAASLDAWTNDLYDYDNSTITANNWLYMGLDEWTVTPDSSSSFFVFSVASNGSLGIYTTGAAGEHAAKPVFYLKSNVALQGGTGASSDPYRLAV